MTMMVNHTAICLLACFFFLSYPFPPCARVDRGRSHGSLPKRDLAQTTLADHILWPGALPGDRARWGGERQSSNQVSLTIHVNDIHMDMLLFAFVCRSGPLQDLPVGWCKSKGCKGCFIANVPEDSEEEAGTGSQRGG